MALKMAVVAPMPRAIVAIAAHEKAGDLRRERKTNRASWRRASIRAEFIPAPFKGQAKRPGWRLGDLEWWARLLGARQLLFHLEVHARSRCLACAEIV